MAKKPLLYHKTFNSYKPDFVSEAVAECVDALVKQGYLKIKVIVHEPVPGDGTKTSTSYLTTVVATISENIDIGFTPPT